MRGDELLDLMRVIDTNYIEEAEIIDIKKKVIPMKRYLRAACISITITVGFCLGILYRNSLKSDNKDVVSKMTMEDKNIIQDMTEMVKSFDNTPINYSDLLLAEGEDNNITLPNDAISDIMSFREELLKETDCCMIVEGIITDVRSKTYKYDTKSDKFEENGVLHNTSETVVYEIEVSKTWYGDDVSGKRIVVEDENYCTDPVFKLKKGMKYVIPLYVYGNDFIYSEYDDFIAGDAKRESKYSTLYPYHPQIMVTEDGGYIVSEHWPTLVQQKARKVVLDNDYEKNIPLKIYFVDEGTFIKQMDKLINKELK